MWNLNCHQNSRSQFLSESMSKIFQRFFKNPYIWNIFEIQGSWLWLQVSDKDFSITLNAYFIVKWSDSRCRLIYKKCRNTALRPSVRKEFFKQKIEPTLIIAGYMLAKQGPPNIHTWLRIPDFNDWAINGICSPNSQVSEKLKVKSEKEV